MSALCLPRPSLYRPQYYFWPLFFCQTRTARSSNSLWPTSTRTAEGWHSPQTRSQSRAAGIWGELPAAPQRAGSARLSPAPATLNSAFLLAASFRIQYSGALCAGTQTHTHRRTPLGALAHPHFYKPLKGTRPKAERAADASQMPVLALRGP